MRTAEHARRAVAIATLAVAALLLAGCEGSLFQAIVADNSYLNSAEHILTVRASNEAHGTVTPAGDVAIREGFPVEIGAVSVSPYKFRGWARVEGTGDVVFSSEFSPETSVGLDGGNAVIQANFALIQPIVLTRDGLVLNPGDRTHAGTTALSSSADLTLTITGDLLGGVSIESASLSGDADFTVTPEFALPHTLGYDETMDLAVRFDPEAIGFRSATLTFALDDPDNPSFAVDISGSGGVWSFEDTLYAAHQAANDWFGWAVAACDTTVSGSPLEFVIGGEPGHNAFTGGVGIRNGTDSWSYEYAGSTSGLNSGAQAGLSVAIMSHPGGGAEEPIMAMGVPADPGGTYPAGSVQVAQRDPAGPNWYWTSSYHQWLSPASPTAEERFGFAVSMSDGFLVAGAPDHDYGGNADTGGVYLFNQSGSYFGQYTGVNMTEMERNENAVIRSPSPEAGGMFGSAIDSDANWFVVGAAEENSQNGAAYVFAASTQALSGELADPAPDLSENDFFGSAVAIAGNYCAVGAYGYGGDTGRVVLFEWDGDSWEYLDALAPLESTGSSFGFSIDMNDSFLVVGAPIEDVGADNTGSIYIYECQGSSFTFRSRLTGAAADAGDQLGFSVSISEDVIAAGMPFYDDGATSNSGRVFAYRCE